MAAESLVAFYFSGAGRFEALGSSSVRFHFRHNVSPFQYRHSLPGTLLLFIAERTLFRTDKHNKLPAFHYRFLLYYTIITEFVSDPVHGLQSNGVGINYFTPPEPHRHLDLVLLPEELLDLLDLEVEVVLLGLRTELDLLCFNYSLFLLCFFELFALLVPVLVIIHYPAYRRIRSGCNLDQVKILIICFVQCSIDC